MLRALHEAGVKIDLVAGRGVGVVGALFAAVDGGAAALGSERASGKAPGAARFYALAPALRVAGAGLLVPLARARRADRRCWRSAVVLAILGSAAEDLGLSSGGAS